MYKTGDKVVLRRSGDVFRVRKEAYRTRGVVYYAIVRKRGDWNEETIAADFELSRAPNILSRIARKLRRRGRKQR